MKNDKQLNIGLFGFGVVGEALYHILSQTPTLNAIIKRICVKDSSKKRSAPEALFTTEANDILHDEDINVIVEVISDSDAAFSIVSQALQKNKHVVSASKKMIAENIETLLALQQQYISSLLYESSACASIPVLRNLEEYYDNDLLHSLQGIVNGSTNFILTKMLEEKLDFTTALKQAQDLGFAEPDPKLDVEGYDAVSKWTEVLLHGYGIVTHPTNTLFTGIQNLNDKNVAYAALHNQEIKLVANAKKLEDGTVAAFVLPQFVEKTNPLSFVKNEYNGVLVESSIADKQFFYGKGAGGVATASAIISDLSALRYNYKYEYKKLYNHIPSQLSKNFGLKIYLSFQSLEFVAIPEFENIEKLIDEAGEKYILGTISVSNLVKNRWWKQDGNSIVVLPNGIVANTQAKIKDVKKEDIVELV
jgi:homoserine dehydrogenase